ncbi:MAG: hypothetical protein ACREXR_13675, partial [Gammaproteobacteria bacterium]
TTGVDIEGRLSRILMDADNLPSFSMYRVIVLTMSGTLRNTPRFGCVSERFRTKRSTPDPAALAQAFNCGRQLIFMESDSLKSYTDTVSR